MVDVHDLFLKVFFVHCWWWGWGWFFGFLFLFGLGFLGFGFLGLGLFARFLLVLLLFSSVVGVGFNGLLLYGFVSGRRRGLDFGLRHDLRTLFKTTQARNRIRTTQELNDH